MALGIGVILQVVLTIQAMIEDSNYYSMLFVIVLAMYPTLIAVSCSLCILYIAQVRQKSGVEKETTKKRGRLKRLLRLSVVRNFKDRDFKGGQIPSRTKFEFFYLGFLHPMGLLILFLLGKLPVQVERKVTSLSPQSPRASMVSFKVEEEDTLVSTESTGLSSDWNSTSWSSREDI
jgi:hypothetical protein